MSKAKDVRLAIEKIRGEIAALEQQRDAAIHAAIPQAEALERARQHVEHRAGQFAELGRAGQFIHRRDPELGQSVAVDLVERAHAGHVTPDAAERFACWAHGDQILAALSRDIEALYVRAGQDGLADDERGQVIEQLDATIFELGIAEERLMLEAEGLGVEIERRARADPRAILEVS